MRRHTPAAALPAILLLSLLACEAEKSSSPLSPSVAGPIPGVSITPPKLLEPAQGFKYKESQQPIKLLIENASSNGVRPVSYMFEVATDTDFTTKVYARSGVPAGEGGRTSVQIDRLDLGRAYLLAGEGGRRGEQQLVCDGAVRGASEAVRRSPRSRRAGQWRQDGVAAADAHREQRGP